MCRTSPFPLFRLFRMLCMHDVSHWDDFILKYCMDKKPKLPIWWNCEIYIMMELQSRIFPRTKKLWHGMKFFVNKKQQVRSSTFKMLVKTSSTNTYIDATFCHKVSTVFFIINLISKTFAMHKDFSSDSKLSFGPCYSSTYSCSKKMITSQLAEIN